VSVVNKRIAVFAAVALILIGVRLFDNGLPGFIGSGVYTAYGAGDREIVRDYVPALNARGCYERIDTPGGVRDAEALLEKMNARLLYTERLEDITIFYAYCPRISVREKTSFGDVNVMIAVSGGKMAVGSPLLKGAY